MDEAHVVVQAHEVTPSLTARLLLARSQLSRGGVALYTSLLGVRTDGPSIADRLVVHAACLNVRGAYLL